MPIIKSAKKQQRQDKKRKARNDFFRKLYREARISFMSAVKEEDLGKARDIFFNKKDKDWKNQKSWLHSIIDKLVKKNIIHKNNWSRKKSRFMKILKSMEKS